MMLASLSERLEAMTEPSREVDALVMFHLMALDSGNPRFRLLKSNPQRPLCLRIGGPIEGARLKEMRANQGEVLQLEIDGAWWLFNSDLTPTVTSDMNSAVDIAKQAIPEIIWDVSSEGLAWVWDRKLDRGPFFGKAFGPAAALISALLCQQHSLSIDTYERFAEREPSS